MSEHRGSSRIWPELSFEGERLPSSGAEGPPASPVHARYCASQATIRLHSSFPLPELRLRPHSTLTPHIPPAGNHLSIFSLSEFDCPRYFIEVGSCSICLVATCLTSLSIMCSRFLRVVTRVRNFFLFEADQYSIFWIGDILLIRSLLNGHLGCFCPLAIVTSAAMPMGVQILSCFGGF